MKNTYIDIRQRIEEAPTWWDENGTPRYGVFTPKSCANIYARHAALVLIACQACGQTFHVAMSWSSHEPPPADLSLIHYGDPPNIQCCPAGPTMNCDDLKIVEWWERDAAPWARRTDKEIILPDHPEYPR